VSFAIKFCDCIQISSIKINVEAADLETLKIIKNVNFLNVDFKCKEYFYGLRVLLYVLVTHCPLSLFIHRKKTLNKEAKKC